MEPTSRPSINVRRRIGHTRARLILAMVLLVSSGGCRHGRSALRPVFGRPAILSPSQPCNTGDCGRVILPAESGFEDPASLSTTPRPEVESTQSSPPSNGSYSPNRQPGNLGDEPMLEPYTPGVDRSTIEGGAGSQSESRLRPPLQPPGRTSARPTARGQQPGTKRAVLQQSVKGFVNDPADLFTPPRADRQWRYIVMHHSAHDTGSFAQIDRDHRERLGTAGCGYHFVVGNGSQSPDGQIEVATRWSEQKAGQHCRDSKLPEINEYGIGICLIGDLDNGQPSERQVAATRALVTYLQDRYGIPKENVVTHDRASRTATSCPGRNFPSQAVLATGRGNSSRQLASN